MLNSVLLIAIGAACGAVLRWLLGLGLNGLFPAIPMGTLAANLVGGYLMGVMIALLAGPLSNAPELRLLVVTGFLGGLTTFSAFSGEVARLLQHGRLAMAGAEIALHVLGSVALTLLGIATVALARR
ncbi:MAG: fluoride efflux transporter CrcB, partial [Steroidobacteraceae bacterium]